MLENNSINQNKFFAQYHGQSILKKHIKGAIIKETSTFNNLSAINKHLSYIELIPLSKISDEHLLYINNIWNSDEVTDSIETPSKSFKYEIESICNWSSSIIDYLRMHGYAVPYLGCSVETLISYGWIVLK